MISQILKMLMFKKDIRTTQLAREIDVPQQTLQRIVAGLSPSPHRKTLVPLAEYFKVSVDQLTGKKPLPEDLATAVISPTQTLSSMQQIPLLDCSDVECFLQDHNPALIKEHLAADASVSSDAFALTMMDSSMEPYVPQGAILILDPRRAPKDRGFVLAKFDGGQALEFRQLLIDGEHRYLKPMNPDLSAFPMRLLREEDKIFGVLLELRHRYDH